MEKVEQLMSMYPDVNYVFDKFMPKGQKGLYIDNHIYLNPNQNKHELNSTVAEELGHYLTTVGDITMQRNNEERKQERRARDLGATLLVTPRSIIDCFNEGCQTTLQCADFLEVTEETFLDAISYYARRFNGFKVEDNYTLIFNENGTLEVYKVFDNG